MRKVINFLKIHFLLCDTFLVIIVFYLCFGVFKKFNINFIDLLIYTNAKQLYPVFLNSSITLLGFLFTGISIIMIFLKDEKLEPLKNDGYFQSILNIYFNAISVCALLTAMSLWGLVAESKIYIAHLTALFSFVLAARLGRCVWIVKKITDIIY